MPIQAIIPKRLFSAARMERVVENFLTMTADAIKIDFDVTTRTWKRRPVFLVRGKKGERTIYTDSDIYKFVSGGTRVRYATMTPGFRAKTRVRYIGSNMGRGGVAFISRKHPRPGIKAREFPEAIIAKWDKEAPRQMQRALDAEVSFYG